MRISKNFIKIFLILFLITIITTTISLIFNFYSQYFTYALLAFSFILLFLIFRKQKLGFWFELPKYIFLILLLLVTISSLKFEFINNTPFLKTIIDFLISQQLWLTITTIVFGALTFYMNRDVINTIEKEKDNEEEKEKKRKEDFDEKYPFWKKFDISYGIKKSFKEKNWLLGVLRIILSPLVFLIKLPYKLVKWMYKEGWWVVLGLIIILMLFTVIKVPYFDVSFTGEHTMKYNSFVEPAKYMYEKSNPFWYQKKYQVNPIENPQGLFSTFGSPPLTEWGLLTMFYLFPNNSLEFNTRLFTHSVGILILIFAFIFFSKWFSKKNALIITFLLAINPIINFSSFVTIQDSWLILFTFVSLIYLSNYIQFKNISNLFYTGLFFGIGISLKYSIFLWLFPIIFILLAFNNKKLSDFIKNMGVIGILSSLSIMAFRTSLRYLPTNVIFSFLKFFLWIGVFILIFYLLKKYDHKIDKFLDLLVKNKILFLMGIIAIVIGGIAFLYFTGIYKFSNEFLTDSGLIFNWDMYKHMLNEQFKPYMTDNVYYLGLIGFAFSLFFGLKKQRKILFSFVIGAFVYWILASKVIFFHNYYTNIVMITFILSIGIMFYLIGKSFRKKYLLIITILFLILLIFPASYDANVERLNKEQDIDSLKEVAEYLINNTNENEIYVDDHSLTTLVILTNLSRISGYNLIHEEIINSVQKGGFGSTMDFYNISYLITKRDNPRYQRYVNIFTDKQLESVAYRRTDIIQSKLDPSYDYFSDSEIRDKLIRDLNIKEKFVLEKKIDLYRIFSFKN